MYINRRIGELWADADGMASGRAIATSNKAMNRRGISRSIRAWQTLVNSSASELFTSVMPRPVASNFLAVGKSANLHC